MQQAISHNWVPPSYKPSGKMTVVKRKTFYFLVISCLLLLQYELPLVSEEVDLGQDSLADLSLERKTKFLK